MINMLTAVTALGIVGLASFSVNRRTRQIGIRRALGASKVAVLRYFMTENLMISLVGVLIGAALTIGSVDVAGTTAPQRRHSSEAFMNPVS